MALYNGLRITGWTLVGAAVLFYVLSVGNLFWPKATPWDDLGLYTVTITLLGFGAGALLLRRAKMQPSSE